MIRLKTSKFKNIEIIIINFRKVNPRVNYILFLAHFYYIWYIISM